MGVTISGWSDRTPATIIEVSPSGKTITLQVDRAIRLDKNGISDSQDYSYETDPKGTIYQARLRKNGRYYIVRTSDLISIDVRRKFYDYSF